MNSPDTRAQQPLSRRSAGQASVELAGGIAVLLLLGLVGFQLLAAGYAAVMADHAAEAAALALVNRNDPAEAARAAVPGWPGGALRVRRSFGRVQVTLFPPSPLGFLRRRLAMSAEAAVRQPLDAGLVSRPPAMQH